MDKLLKRREQLKAEIGQYSGDIEVEASDGVLSLRGKVPDEARAKYALAAAQKVPGVKKVIDLIDIGN